MIIHVIYSSICSKHVFLYIYTLSAVIDPKILLFGPECFREGGRGDFMINESKHLFLKSPLINYGDTGHE
jgi:hypothetical protein